MAAVVGNFAQVNAALSATAARVDLADEQVEEATAELVAQIAQNLAPRFTGFMATQVDEEGGAVVVNTDYAGYVEWGTRYHKAQPFLRPAKELAEIPARQGAERIYTIASR